MVCFLPYNFFKNFMLDLLIVVDTFNRDNIYFCKKWAEHTMDLFTLDLVSTGLQLDLKDIPLQQGGGSHHTSAKIYIFSLEI